MVQVTKLDVSSVFLYFRRSHSNATLWLKCDMIHLPFEAQRSH